MIGNGRQFGRHEEVAPHPPHGIENPLPKGGLADLLAHEVGVKSNHLHHVPAQDGEVHFRHGLGTVNLTRFACFLRFSGSGR